jgi:hypothetical protein
MQLLTLASIFFLVYSVAAQGAEKIGPCTKMQLEAGTPAPGKFVPQCTQFGYFKPVQCHPSTGLCWCAVPDTGKAIEGTTMFRQGMPKCTICNIKRAEALRPAGYAGNYAPQCDEEGLFSPTQYWASTGQRWCVDRYTGTEISGTRMGPGAQGPECGTLALWVGLAMHQELDTKGPCYAKIVEERGRAGTPGFYMPTCTEHGYYKTEQYHSSTGHSWCVNPSTGAEIPGTRRTATEPRANCGACFKELEEKLTKKPVLGADLPQCNEENGDYLPEQHREGHRWCANPKTGALEGKKIPPGDKTPLPCVNH